MVATIQRGIRCPECKEDIYSNSVHDNVRCSCGAVFIDGGYQYLRFGGRLLEEIEPVNRIVTKEQPSHFRDEKKEVKV